MAIPTLIPKTDSTKKDRVDLRLYNTIVIFDVYTIARSPEAARKAILDAIASAQYADDLKPTEQVAKEVTMDTSIRSSWTEQSPFVAADVTDAEFEQLKGITTLAAFERFYTKAKK